jgi:hypothetical protein
MDALEIGTSAKNVYVSSEWVHFPKYRITELLNSNHKKGLGKSAHDSVVG